METLYIPGKGKDKINLKRLKILNNSIDFCNVVYCSDLEEALTVPEEIKIAWRKHSLAKREFKQALAKHNIILS